MKCCKVLTMSGITACRLTGAVSYLAEAAWYKVISLLREVSKRQSQRLQKIKSSPLWC